MTKGWPRFRISEVCSEIIDCINKTAPTVDGPTPYKMIRTTNVRSGWVNHNNVKYVTEKIFKKWARRGRPHIGDVILTREAPLGEVGLLRSPDRIFLGQRLVMYRADKSKLDNRFLLYSFLENDLQGQIKSLGSGATVEHMRVPDCENLIISLSWRRWPRPSTESGSSISYILGTRMCGWRNPSLGRSLRGGK